MPSAAPAPFPPNLRGVAEKIVVVEDEPTIADAVAARLRADGYDVAVAHDGPSGVALSRLRIPPSL